MLCRAIPRWKSPRRTAASASSAADRENITMAIVLNKARIALSIDAETGNPQDLGTGKFALNLAPNWLFTHGTGNGQANEQFSDIRTLAASANENIDLAGTLIGHFGETLTFTKIKAIVILADTGNTNDVIVGGAASNGF